MANSKPLQLQYRQQRYTHPEDIEDENSNFSYNPKEAGPPWWDTWHMMAAQANTPAKRKLLKQFVENHIPILFGCKLCREHFIPKLKKFPIDKYMSSAYQIWLHSYLIHDDVNKDLGKRSPSIEEAKKKYFPQKSASCHVYCEEEEEEGSDKEVEEDINVKKSKKIPSKKSSPVRTISGATVMPSTTNTFKAKRETKFYIRG